MNKIPAISISMILLISILLPVASACGESDGFTVAVDHDCIELEKMIKDGKDWVNTYTTPPGEIVRFRIKITYHDVDGPDAKGYRLQNITVVDTLPDGLIYMGNSTHEETVDGQIITWELDDDFVLTNNESVSIEFDVQVTFIYCSYENLAEVFAIERCYGQARYESATATVIPECITCDKYMDVDDDGVDEEAHDANHNLDDGFEEYFDPNGNSTEVLKIDGDNDGKYDHFIDIVDKGDGVDKYWDPDSSKSRNGFVSDVWVIDVDYDEHDEWVYDSDGDGEYDRYYDSVDEEIKPYVAYTLTVIEEGDGEVSVDPSFSDFYPLYLEDFEVELTAVADTGASFVNYSGDVSSESETILVTMDSDKTITALFSDGGNGGDLSVKITRPENNSLYMFNIRLKDLENKTEIIGPINVKAKIQGGSEIEKVEFKLDGEVKKTDTRGPIYNWWWLLKPIGDKENFTIQVVAYDVGGNVSSDSITVTRSAFNPIRDHWKLSLLLAGIGTLLVLKNRDTGGDDDGGDDDGPHVEPDTKLAPRVDAGGPYHGQVGKAVQFDGSNTIDPNGDDLTFVWTFGDGETGSGESPKHTYDKPGKYTVKLRVTDESGLSAEDTTTIEISEGSAGDSDDDDKGDEGDLFWYILTALGVAMAAAIGLLYFRRDLYV